MKKYLTTIATLVLAALAIASTQAEELPNESFKVLQLNTWMLRLPVGYSIAQDIHQRALILPEVVARTGADIVVFQELWAGKVRDYVTREMKKLGYPYIAWKSYFGFPRGVLGNGLFIASKFPLAGDTALMRFQEYTEDDEYFAYKGAIKTSVEIPGVGPVDLYDSHLGAVGYDPKHGEYVSGEEQNKTQQMRELAKWIESTKTASIQILSADLNSHYYDFEGGKWTNSVSDVYRLVTDSSSGLGMVDTYHSVHGYPAGDCTYCMDNVYASGGHYGNAPSEVEDYIFINPNSQVSVESSEIVFKEDLSKDPELAAKFHLKKMPKHISDHYGLLTTFKVSL